MRRWGHGLFAAVLLLVGGLLLWAGGELVLAMRDPHLGGPQPASQAWRWHRALTPAFARWAQARRAGDAAARLSLHDIAGTEWPLFGTVFYLRATENLDRAWDAGSGRQRPAEYARDAIDAAADLLADPGQAAWVQQHWGAPDYLRRENVFYRMLVIDGLATQLRLLGRSPHVELLREQATGLAAELAQSATGLLADYPDQTFPADVAAAWHAIRRADAVLGTDHAAAASLGLRGFVGAMAPSGLLPPYAWFDDPPQATEVRGCANAWLLHHAPFLWPEQARIWFDENSASYWQSGALLVGYREFARDAVEPGRSDIDSGPVIAGLGTAATAFGIGAARSMGAGAPARAMALQGLALSVPLPTGRLLAPRLLSDLSDAPLLGEAALLYNLSQPPAPGFETSPAQADLRSIPGLVWLILMFQLGFGAACVWRGMIRLRSVTKSD